MLHISKVRLRIAHREVSARSEPSIEESQAWYSSAAVHDAYIRYLCTGLQASGSSKVADEALVLPSSQSVNLDPMSTVFL